MVEKGLAAVWEGSWRPAPRRSPHLRLDFLAAGARRRTPLIVGPRSPGVPARRRLVGAPSTTHAARPTDPTTARGPNGPAPEAPLRARPAPKELSMFRKWCALVIV